jgi:uncharacterized protein
MLVRIFFASDIHASTKCWLKFLSARRHFECDILIIGGDITGKFIVPVIQLPNGTWEAEFLGVKRRIRTEGDLDRLKARISTAGQYAFETTPEEFETYSGDQPKIDALFKDLVLERVREWIRIADERLDGSGVRCLVSGANDDYFEVDDVLRESSTIEMPEGQVLDLNGFEIASVGYGNPTPWNCPRDIPETELYAKIEHVADQITDMSRAIFNLHVPPYGSGLDDAPLLTEDLRVVAGGLGGARMVPVGSTAVRSAIDRYQPLMSLHGHIHESKGIRRFGRTCTLNPGSEYAEGILDAAIIDLSPSGAINDVKLISG